MRLHSLAHAYGIVAVVVAVVLLLQFAQQGYMHQQCMVPVSDAAALNAAADLLVSTCSHLYLIVNHVLHKQHGGRVLVAASRQPTHVVH
jgi:hypothetical protein